MPVKCYCSSNLPRQLSLHAGFGRGSLPGRSAPGGAAPPVNRPNSAGLLNDIVIAVSIIRMCIQTGSSDNRRLHFQTPCLHVAGPSVQAPGAPGIPGFAPPMPVRTSSTGTPGAAYRPPAPGTGAYSSLHSDVASLFIKTLHVPAAACTALYQRASAQSISMTG